MTMMIMNMILKILTLMIELVLIMIIIHDGVGLNNHTHSDDHDNVDNLQTTSLCLNLQATNVTAFIPRIIICIACGDKYRNL